MQQTSSALAVSSIPCSQEPIPAQGEGPYYKAGTPQRTDIREQDAVGRQLILTGRVLDTQCNPIANAWLDFWQADGNGSYDNAGFNLRGHQFTNANGEYRLVTAAPGEYPGRPPHIHFKVRPGEDSRTVTSQLYLPGSTGNQADSIFRNETVVTVISSTSDQIRATFDIVIEK